MPRVKLDDIDLKILNELQLDGRITNVDLAGRVGVSPPPCLRRVRALEESGVILGYYTNLSMHELGFNVNVFAQVGLVTQAEPDLVAFEALVQSWAEVRECYMLAGETDFLLKVVAEDWETYQSFVINKLTVAPNVGHVKSSLAIRSSKVLQGVPVRSDN
ncbi:MAG: ArsR family transcriptional regulator [Rhodospirillaceae bacterium]|nr:ArsR family transcriptional regulator [Rhodospirillaceae bacterium]OUT76257.1 MAG: ArsR family transcriptional regulator [Rhodospirillaceae bacterium TMED23]|tara:strand:+ start:1778 stop:2257 length:480 start_codon:yes stop_codon:yes gene_type:complete